MCRFGTFTLADLALKRVHLFLQFVLCCLQRAILRLDLRQHLVERVGQDADLVAADLCLPERNSRGRSAMVRACLGKAQESDW